jgi:preprotein translocase subunit YajC
MWTLAQQPGGGGGLMQMLIIFVPMILIMYLMVFKPQQKKQKEHQEMLKKLKVGDQVVTSGGMYGTIAAVREKSFLIKVADNVKIECARASVVGLTESEPAADEKKKG